MSSQNLKIEGASELGGMIMDLPVFDTHNHLDSSASLCAQNFWDVAHYFWFIRELQGVGYPHLDDAMELSVAERAEAFIKAFRLSRNTAWSQAVKMTLKNLWDIELTDVESVLEADRRIVATSGKEDWAEEVCERINMKGILLSERSQNGLQRIGDRTHLMGHVKLPDGELTKEMLASPDPAIAVENHARFLQESIAKQIEAGQRVFRMATPKNAVSSTLDKTLTPEVIEEYILHRIYQAFDRQRAVVQVFIGMQGPTVGYEQKTRVHRYHAINATDRVAALHDLFDQYFNCRFEIVNAAHLSNLDVVNAARIHPNVIPGGLWWFNFRPSNYVESMQYRLEGLPAVRCMSIATDARCIEWLYCKTLLVKRIMAQFFTRQVEEGWLDEETALYTARCWLHDNVVRNYVPNREDSLS